MNMVLSKYERALAYEILIKREYKAIDEQIMSANVIFDIGGHLGFFSIYAILLKSGFYRDGAIFDIDNIEGALKGMKLSIDFKIHFFEPVKSTYERARTILRQYDDIFVWNNFGIRQEEHTGGIYINESKSMQNSIFSGTTLNKAEESAYVEFKNIEKYIKEHKVEKVDLVKMDIEGAEFEVINNLSGKFLNDVAALFLEYHIFDERLILEKVKLLTKLKKAYKYLQITEGEHSPDFGYIMARNQ